MINTIFFNRKSFHSNNYYFTIFIALFFSFVGYTQVHFVEGYYIDNQGQRTECLIKNVDWLQTPDSFEFKATENSKAEVLTVNQVNEFGVLGESKFVRFMVPIDRSKNANTTMRAADESGRNREQLFLKVLVEGQASLYEYNQGSLNLFFFKKEGYDLEHLVFSRYEINYKVRENNHFKQQLWNEFKCHDITENRIAKIKYIKDDLIDFFVDYNRCIDSEITWLDKNKKINFHLSLRPGLISSSLIADNPIISGTKVEFNNETGFRFGIEGEVVLPFNNGKWAIIAEPTYQYYKTTLLLEHPSVVIDNYPVEVDYSSLEIPLGVRYYLFLNNNSRMFVNLLFVADVSINNEIKYGGDLGGPYNFTLDSDTGSNFAFGLGYKYTKYSLELRYGFKRDLLLSYMNYTSDYKSLSLVFGYTLF